MDLGLWPGAWAAEGLESGHPNFVLSESLRNDFLEDAKQSRTPEIATFCGVGLLPPTLLGRRGLSLGLGFAALWALILPLPASAAEVGDADARAVKTVIEAQLASLTSGNAERAFSYASAAIRLQFGDAAKFMSMVQTSYPMLLQRAATSYFVPELADGAVLQKLQLRDRAGRLWLVTYQLLQQPDAAWRVNGCAVRPADDKASI